MDTGLNRKRTPANKPTFLLSDIRFTVFIKMIDDNVVHILLIMSIIKTVAQIGRMLFKKRIIRTKPGKKA